MPKRRTFSSFHALEPIMQPGSDDELEVDHYESRNESVEDALELILQPGSDDELEVDHCESSNESVEDDDFAEDVPRIDGNPEYDTNGDGELSDEPDTKDGGEGNCFVYIFQRSQKTCKQRC